MAQRFLGGRTVFLPLVFLLSAAGALGQTIGFTPQPYSRIPGLDEYRVSITAPGPEASQIQGMRVILEAAHQSIRIYHPTVLRSYVDQLNKRSIWRWVGVVAEAGGWSFLTGTALESIKVKEKWAKAAAAGGASLLTIGRTLYDREYKPVSIPADDLPPLIAIPPGQTVDYAVWAEPK